jgi:Trypsin-like peptidase domain
MTRRRSESLWGQLTLTERMKIALAVARRRGSGFIRQFPGVVAVGAGFRLQNGKTVDNDVCLRFLVAKKHAHRRRSSIKREIIVYVNRRGQRRAVRIPTDISPFSGGRPHRDLRRGIVTQINTDLHSYGAACCLVRDARNTAIRYLLTCYHVISPQMSVPVETVNCLDSGSKRTVAVFAPFVNGASPGVPVDAALVALAPGVAPLSVWGRRVVAKASDADLPRLSTATPLWVLGRQTVPRIDEGNPGWTRAGPIPASFQTVFATHRFEYPEADDIFTFADTIEYRADVRAGDSGAALLDDTGKLYGMHFYGLGEFGYALSAPRIFESGSFPIDIWLD